MKTDRVRFAILGYGHIGKRHAAMISRHPEAELVAVADTRGPEACEFFDSGVIFFPSLEAMLHSQIPIDVVNIATPNGLHELHALQVINADRHVVIEKPMALSKAGCESIIYKALQRSKHVFCVMQNRYSPPSAWLKGMIEERRLGKIFMVQINCYWNRDDRYYTGKNWHGSANLDGGTLFTQFSHFVDIMYWIFGDITNIKARFNDFNHQTLTQFEDSGFVSFDFVSGGMGCFNYSTSVWNSNLESSITVIGEYGSIKIGGQYMNEVEVCSVKDYAMPELAPSNPPNDYGAYKGSAANHHYIIENVVDVLRERARITTNALEGLKVVDIIERIYQLKR